MTKVTTNNKKASSKSQAVKKEPKLGLLAMKGVKELGKNQKLARETLKKFLVDGFEHAHQFFPDWTTKDRENITIMLDYYNSVLDIISRYDWTKKATPLLSQEDDREIYCTFSYVDSKTRELWRTLFDSLSELTGFYAQKESGHICSTVIADTFKIRGLFNDIIYYIESDEEEAQIKARENRKYCRMNSSYMQDNRIAGGGIKQGAPLAIDFIKYLDWDKRLVEGNIYAIDSERQNGAKNFSIAFYNGKVGSAYEFAYADGGLFSYTWNEIKALYRVTPITESEYPQEV